MRVLQGGGDPLQDRRRIALERPADAEKLDHVEPPLAGLDLRDPRGLLSECLGEGALRQTGLVAGFLQDGDEPVLGLGIKGLADRSDIGSATVAPKMGASAGEAGEMPLEPDEYFQAHPWRSQVFERIRAFNISAEHMRSYTTGREPVVLYDRSYAPVTLDLHGFRRREAERAVRTFLQLASECRLPVVNVICGKRSVAMRPLLESLWELDWDVAELVDVTLDRGGHFSFVMRAGELGLWSDAVHCSADHEDDELGRRYWRDWPDDLDEEGEDGDRIELDVGDSRRVECPAVDGAAPAHAAADQHEQAPTWSRGPWYSPPPAHQPRGKRKRVGAGLVILTIVTLGMFPPAGVALLAYLVASYVAQALDEREQK